MNVDETLRGLLFRKFHIGRLRFDFLEALLAVCITAVGYLIRTPFEYGPPHWTYLLAEWYLALTAGVLVFRYTGSRKRALGTYAILLILPTVVAEGTILRGSACLGALLLVCALLFWENGRKWLFTLTVTVLLLYSVRYVGILAACAVFWQKEELKTEQLLLLLAGGGARLAAAYRAYLHAGYTLTTFHWPNIYEIVGRESIQGQMVDPIALVGLFLAVGLTFLTLWLFGMGKWKTDRAFLMRLLLFFGLAAVYFLPYMDQSSGYLFCVLGVIYFMVEPGDFLVPVLLQIAAYAGYQECFNGESMMPMAVFAVAQFLIIAYLGIRLLQEMGVIRIWKEKNLSTWTD